MWLSAPLASPGTARESTFLCFATGSDNPRGLAFGPDGYLYGKVLPTAMAIGPYGAAKCEPSRGQEYDSR